MATQRIFAQRQLCRETLAYCLATKWAYREIWPVPLDFGDVAGNAVVVVVDVVGDDALLMMAPFCCQCVKSGGGVVVVVS